MDLATFKELWPLLGAPVFGALGGIIGWFGGLLRDRWNRDATEGQERRRVAREQARFQLNERTELFSEFIAAARDLSEDLRPNRPAEELVALKQRLRSLAARVSLTAKAEETRTHAQLLEMNCGTMLASMMGISPSQEQISALADESLRDSLRRARLDELKAGFDFALKMQPYYRKSLRDFERVARAEIDGAHSALSEI